MKIDISAKLYSLHGQPVPKTSPTKEEIRELEKHPKVKNQFGQDIEDMSYLPDETIGNFLVSCLATYKSDDLKVWVMVTLIAGKIIDCKTKELELQDKYVKFLCNVLAEVTQRIVIEKIKVPGNKPGDKEVEQENKVTKQGFSPWATTRVRIILGEKLIEKL